MGVFKLTFPRLCFGQGAREEGPADVERACEDAQVTPHCNGLTLGFTLKPLGSFGPKGSRGGGVDSFLMHT